KGGWLKDTAISLPHVMSVLPVASKPTEKMNSAMAEGLKICARRPSFCQVMNSLHRTPVASIRNCRKYQSGLNQINRFALTTIGRVPNPRIHLSRRDQQTSMSRA